MCNVPAHKQTDPARAPGQVVYPVRSNVRTLGDYISRASAIDMYHADAARLVREGSKVAA